MINPALRGNALDSMRFLNEVVQSYPDAISLAPGRPQERLFDVAHSQQQLQHFLRDEAARLGVHPSSLVNSYSQYGRTGGIVNAHVAKQLLNDEGIDVHPEHIIMTVGAQEALAIVLLTVMSPQSDVLLVPDPTYIGITGLAQLLGIKITPIETSPNGIAPAALLKAYQSACMLGTPKLMYDIPTFNNPLGYSLSAPWRHETLALCNRLGLLYIEDNAYGMFRYEGEDVPSLKALDKHENVLYIASYSKVLFPGLRLGCLVADQRLSDGSLLVDKLTKAKSFLTVNTSTSSQLTLAAVLAENGHSLRSVVGPRLRAYAENRDMLLQCLDDYLDATCGCTWNRPEGGFFLRLRFPFAFLESDCRSCAEQFGVILVPMSFFSSAGTFPNEARLSFSSTSPGEIKEAVYRLSQYVRSRLAKSESVDV